MPGPGPGVKDEESKQTLNKELSDIVEKYVFVDFLKMAAGCRLTMQVASETTCEVFFC